MGKFWNLKFRRELSGWLFVLPMLLFFASFVVYPILSSVWGSLYAFDYAGYTFAGLDNYKQLLGDSLFWKAVWNTIVFVLYLVPSITFLALFLAALIHRYPQKMQSFFKAAFYVPGVTSIVSLAMVWEYMYNNQFGLGNYLLKRFGLPPVNFLGSEYAYTSLALILVTISLGASLVVFSAALGGIPKDLYESASLDGATGTQTFFRITLPMLKPSVLYVVVTSTIGAFQVFAIILLMTGGGPAYKTTTILMLIYREAFINMNFGIANAMGIMLCLLICLIAFLQFKLLKSDVEY
ncbi:carbohydrate ABC transporter permease [Paenibacillus ginsengarvi]|uniref:Sugar ABC transporter permease n=1 Tax=Paenibacillus ginsengarvi TaxID=400777 RepID=A0A3B0BDT9_9BACL|nr:sugar ABC transporter permease [Paenibacillus ginsengarvi]RKN70611.1 sugar ABC transporter permease [Paenibacillus ginsengarvi]